MSRNPPSADRLLHNIARFAAFPSHAEGLDGETRGRRLRSFMGRLLAENADAFAHGVEIPNPDLARLFRGEEEAYRRVAQRDRSVGKRTNLYGHTPLHLAVMLGAGQVVDALIGKGASVSATDRWGNTPLHWAMFVGDEVLAERLAAAGADPEVRNAFDGIGEDYALLFGERGGAPIDEAGVAVVESDGTAVTTWPFDRVAADAGFTPWRRSQADNDLIFDLFLRSRGGLSRKDSIRILTEPGPAAPVALRWYGGALGWGVVTTAAVQQGSYLGSYCGRIMHVERGTEPDLAYASNLGGYASHVQVAVVGRDVGSIMTRANSSTGPADANMKFRTGWRRGEPVIEMNAAHDLAAGTQLLWDYGASYWRERGIEPQGVGSG